MSHESTKADDAVDRELAAMDAELAKPDASTAALRARMRTLRETILLQRTLLERARDYARDVKGRFAPENVASVVEEARAQLASRLGSGAARLAFVAEVPASLRAHVDRHALLQALQNLLQNAVEAYDAGAERTPVRVLAKGIGSPVTRVELRVVDEGAGMSEDALATLFVPFRTTKRGGTGVGLLMAKKMVEEVHGGTLAVRSVKGEGTTVVLTLPARQAGVKERS
jgi:two-component system C4-dicarboxylate transport sensor histidine kinase DctB